MEIIHILTNDRSDLQIRILFFILHTIRVTKILLNFFVLQNATINFQNNPHASSPNKLILLTNSLLQIFNCCGVFRL